MQSARESLARVVENARRLGAEKGSLDVHGAHARIGALFRDDFSFVAGAAEGAIWERDPIVDRVTRKCGFKQAHRRSNNVSAHGI